MIFLTRFHYVPLLLIHPSSYTFFFHFSHHSFYSLSRVFSCSQLLQSNPPPSQSPFHAHITLFVASYIPPHFPDSSGYPLLTTLLAIVLTRSFLSLGPSRSPFQFQPLITTTTYHISQFRIPRSVSDFSPICPSFVPIRSLIRPRLRVYGLK
jgi:hypothetical protein